MDLPQRFGRYLLLERVGAGGMAEVFLARSHGIEGFEKHLVVKRIRPGMADSPHLVGLFVQEARITAGLDHPNVVQIYELGRANGCPYIAMEYIRGRTLSQIRKALGGPMDVSVAVHLTCAVLRGLAYAHSLSDAQGRPLRLVHRDVSPHNVIVGFQGEVKLLDFGIARIVGDAPGPSSTRDGNPGAGKVAYMSPEQASGRPIDHRSDIYSAGVVLVELLLGRRVFDDPDPREKLRRVRAGDVPDPRVENPEVPDELWDIIQRMVAREPGDRPERADLLQEDLRAFLFHQGALVGVEEVRAMMRQAFPGPAARPPGLHFDLDALVADLERLGAGEELGTATATPAHSASGLTQSWDEAGGRKPVVVLALDTVGQARLTARLAPEDCGRLAFRAVRRVRQVADRYGGRLVQWRDGQGLVIFGLDRTSEHDLRRALGCASRLLPVVGGVHPEMRLAVGVHRGEVSVGAPARRRRFQAHGDVVRLAWRLCAAAEAGEVLLSEAVSLASRERYRLEETDAVELRGGRQARAWRLLGHNRGLVTAEGRWLRRGDELEVLREALLELGEGKGGVLAVTGSAGLGKTHLVRELRLRAQRHRVPLYAGHALPYGGERPLAAFQDIVLGVLGLGVGASARQRRAGLKDLAQLGLSRQDRFVLGELFVGDQPRRLRRGWDPERRALGALVAALASSRPLVLAFEDVQHLEAPELTVLSELIQDARELPVLFLVTCRAGLPDILGPVARHIRLGRLEAGSVALLVAEQLGVSEVDPGLLRQLSVSAEGNPLYVRALVDHLVQSGRIVVRRDRAEVGEGTNLTLPPSLRGLIASRLEGLSLGARGALQLAAVLGPQFPVALFEDAGARAGILDDLEGLVAEGLLEETEPGEAAFRSPLVWEVVDHAMPPRRRQVLHRAVAEALRSRGDERLPEDRAELARHLAGAGQLLAAAREVERDGDRLREAELLSRATRTWEQGIAWLADAQGSGRLRLEADLRRKAGAARALQGELLAAEAHLLVALELVGEMADPEREAWSQLELGRLYRAQGKIPLARVHLEAALEACGDEITGLSVDLQEGWRREVAVGAHEMLGLLALDEGAEAEARRQLGEARRRAGEDAHLAARALLGEGTLLVKVGDYDAALPVLQAALVHARSAGARILEGRVVNNIGIVHHARGRYEQALARFRASLELRQGLGYRRGVAVNLHNIGEAHFRLGDLARAGSAFQESAELAQALSWTAGRVLNEAFLAYLDLVRQPEGGREAALPRLRAAAAAARVGGDPRTPLLADWLLACGLRDCGHLDEARACCDTGAEEAEQRGLTDLVRDFREVLDGAPVGPRPGADDVGRRASAEA